MDDRIEELETLFAKQIEEIKNSSYEELIKICEHENLEYENIDEDELRQLLIEYFKEEIDE